MIEQSGDRTGNIDPMRPRGRRTSQPRSLQRKNQWTGLIETDLQEDAEAPEGACGAGAEAVLGTELSTSWTREGNEILKDTLGMIKQLSELKTAQVDVGFAPGDLVEIRVTRS